MSCFQLMYVRFSHNVHSVTSPIIVSKILILLMYVRFSLILNAHFVAFAYVRKDFAQIDYSFG